MGLGIYTWVAICIPIVVTSIVMAVVGSTCRRPPRSVGWEVRLQCTCGWHTKAPSGDESYVQVGCCPECGCRKPRFAGKPGDWELRVMKWTDGAWQAQG